MVEWKSNPHLLPCEGLRVQEYGHIEGLRAQEYGHMTK